MIAKVVEINGGIPIAVDEDGAVVEIHGSVANLKPGDYVEGALLNDEDDENRFYIDAVRRIEPGSRILADLEIDMTAYQLYKTFSKTPPSYF
jgi:hypothetical protein